MGDYWVSLSVAVQPPEINETVVHIDIESFNSVSDAIDQLGQEVGCELGLDYCLASHHERMDDAGLLSHYFPNSDMSYYCILKNKAEHMVTNTRVVQSVSHLAAKLARTRSMKVGGGAETVHEHGVGNTAAEHAAAHKLGGHIHGL